jgi:mRNA-degrading endonuclease RelE of RelBE toxin-antitoxin system
MGWTEKELQKLKKEYQRKTDEELAEEVGKTKGEVRGKRRRMGKKTSRC